MVVHSYPVEDTKSDREESNTLSLPSYLKVFQYIHRGFTVVAELTKWQQRVVLHSWFEVNIIRDTVNTDTLKILHKYEKWWTGHQFLPQPWVSTSCFYTVIKKLVSIWSVCNKIKQSHWAMCLQLLLDFLGSNWEPSACENDVSRWRFLLAVLECRPWEVIRPLLPQLLLSGALLSHELHCVSWLLCRRRGRSPFSGCVSLLEQGRSQKWRHWHS